MIRIKPLFLILTILIVVIVAQFPANIANAQEGRHCFLGKCPSLQEGCIFPSESEPLKPVLQKCAVPLNNPDQFAWELFSYVNRKASADLQGTTPNSHLTNNAFWETWADDPLTFPRHPNPADPPQWPDRTPPPKRLFLRSKVERAQLPLELQKLPGKVDCPDDSPCEEVRRNKATFDYIVNNHLWYTQGLVQAFKKAQAVLAQGDPIANFVKSPIDSIEVKANWVPITEEQKSDYHWNYNVDGKLYGLVAMHISSKVLPNWFWATFEWVDNKGRCDYIGCHDSFGYLPADIPPHQTTDGTYPPGTRTEDLSALFKQNGLTDEWGQEWQHYRLKGSMVNFVDSTGQPLLLGNSVTEEGFVPTASCITCHSRASVNAQGKPALSVFKSFNPRESNNGAPDPNWFYSDQGKTLKSLPVDFIWAIPFANPERSAD